MRFQSRKNGQLFFSVNAEMELTENAPVRLTSTQLEELDYRELYRAYSPQGRKSKVDPRVLFRIMVHGLYCSCFEWVFTYSFKANNEGWAAFWASFPRCFFAAFCNAHVFMPLPIVRITQNSIKTVSSGFFGAGNR